MKASAIRLQNILEKKAREVVRKGEDKEEGRGKCLCMAYISDAMHFSIAAISVD